MYPQTYPETQNTAHQFEAQITHDGEEELLVEAENLQQLLLTLEKSVHKKYKIWQP